MFASKSSRPPPHPLPPCRRGSKICAKTIVNDRAFRAQAEKPCARRDGRNR
ncbi:MAG: hypothetical protein OJF58_003319 [Enhydrobacter sp.]|nr:MAG: hypothetical protein OJF58_003319 [Enhydrobacter sp.]